MFKKKKNKSTTSTIGVIGSIDAPISIILASKGKEKTKFGLNFIKSILKLNEK